ncbi:hypothetical protein [Psychrobacter sp. P2G3]|nr:hypothetical protein [Psychrobacter sp. P2G3]
MSAYHKSKVRNLSALPIIDTDDKLIAAAAIIGLSKGPKNGKPSYA